MVGRFDSALALGPLSEIGSTKIQGAEMGNAVSEKLVRLGRRRRLIFFPLYDHVKQSYFHMTSLLLTQWLSQHQGGDQSALNLFISLLNFSLLNLQRLENSASRATVASFRK